SDSFADLKLRKPITGVAACCARTASGQAAADPAITLMKSRRRIAFTKAGTTPNRTRLQQGFPTGGMGSDRHFAWQQPSGSNVRFGSEADISHRPMNVRFTPESGHLPSLSDGRGVKGLYVSTERKVGDKGAMPASARFAPYCGDRSTAPSVSDAFLSFVSELASSLWGVVARGNGCVCSHNVRAAASGSIAALRHHDRSSPDRWTSR